jgi:hypothetical protein
MVPPGELSTPGTDRGPEQQGTYGCLHGAPGVRREIALVVDIDDIEALVEEATPRWAPC